MTFAAIRRHSRAPSPLAGRLAAQSLLFALGESTFMTGSAVFFTQIVGVSAGQVGLGLTCAGIAAFLAALPMGKLADGFGPKKMWTVSAAGQSALNDVLLHALPWFTALAFLVNAVAIGRLPRAAHDDRTPEDRKTKTPGRGRCGIRVGSSPRSSAGSSGSTRCCSTS